MVSTGYGYPRGLKGEDIPMEGRLLAVADAFDALTHDRAHQKALTPAEAIKEIEHQSGRQFDPKLVRAFFKLYEQGDLAVLVDS